MPGFARLLALLLAGLALAALPGCGEDEIAEEARQRAEEIRRDAEREIDRRTGEVRERAKAISDRLRRRVREVLDDIGKAVPAASQEPPRAREGTDEQGIERFLTDTIESVDRYWTRTLREADLDAPRVSYLWVAPGQASRTRCGAVADDTAAFYCPGDDTIYIAQRLASDLYQGIADDFPGERAGAGNAIGDFGLAYVVAHEYAHNVQNELGFYTLRPREGTKAFELMADCMAGLWGNSVFREGQVKEGDVEEAISTAQAAGDFDFGNDQHHGTPEERRRAWLDGFENGEPARCQSFVQ